MNDLDRLIDEAARQMAQHEPPDALSGAVMQRVAREASPFSRRLVWGSVAAAMAVAAVVMFVNVNRAAPPQQAQGSGLTAQGDERAHGSRLMAQGVRTEPVVNQPAPSSRVAVVASMQEAMPVDEMRQIDDPIALESITPEQIAVERLDVKALATIDVIEIAPIAIPPISSSDD